MRIIGRNVVAVAATLLTQACSSPTDGAKSAQPLISALPRALSGDEKLAADATTEFGLALFRTVNARSARDSSLALSPISASLALGMLMNGAELETLDQVRRTLAFSDRPVPQINAAYKALIPLLSTLDPSVKMAFANAAWFDIGSPPSTTFTQSLTDVFAARVSTLQLTAPGTVGTINDWVSAATNARIPKIVESFRSDDIALLVNATYFKGNWRAQFDKARTQSAPFQVSSTVTVSVPTMMNDDGLVRLGRGAGNTTVGEIPFGGDAFVMTIAVPPLGALESMIDSLTPARWKALLATMPPATDTLRIQLPRFRLETSRTLNAALSELGMPRPFMNAQLNPMFVTPASNRIISSVLQKVFVDVNEEGAEAAAATSVGIGVTSLPPSLTVDRPFLFVIRERLSGTILFIGKVVRPVAP
jgi:serine protease inhibitor